MAEPTGGGPVSPFKNATLNFTWLLCDMETWTADPLQMALGLKGSCRAAGFQGSPDGRGSCVMLQAEDVRQNISWDNLTRHPVNGFLDEPLETGILAYNKCAT